MKIFIIRVVKYCPSFPGTWSCPETSGVSPDPRAWCSFTQIDAYQAVLFGGWVKGRSGENDLYILNMNKWVTGYVY